MRKLNARELRTTPVDLDEAKKIRKNPITIICDNVLDTYNVGAIFRLADAVAAEKVYLCGATETPPNSKIKKASINTWQWVCWQYAETATAAISRLRQDYDGQAKIKNPATIISPTFGITSAKAPAATAKYESKFFIYIYNSAQAIVSAITIIPTIYFKCNFSFNKNLSKTKTIKGERGLCGGLTAFKGSITNDPGT